MGLAMCGSKQVAAAPYLFGSKNLKPQGNLCQELSNEFRTPFMCRTESDSVGAI